MKTITKKLAALGLLGLGLVMGGCAPGNEATMSTDPITGKSTGAGFTPPGAPKSSAEAYKQNKSPMERQENRKAYKDSQG